MIVFDLSHRYASIVANVDLLAPTLILGIGGGSSLNASAFRVLRDPYRKWKVVGSSYERSVSVRLSAEGSYEAWTYPDSRRGNPLVVEFSIQKVSGGWSGLTLEITKVTEKLLLSAICRSLVVEPDTKVKLHFRKLGTLNPEVRLEGEEALPEVTSRFERIGSVEVDE